MTAVATVITSICATAARSARPTIGGTGAVVVTRSPVADAPRSIAMLVTVLPVLTARRPRDPAGAYQLVTRRKRRCYREVAPDLGSAAVAHATRKGPLTLHSLAGERPVISPVSRGTRHSAHQI
ncbi:hypothetical protein GCM10027215_37750 [Nocardioides zeae]